MKMVYVTRGLGLVFLGASVIGALGEDPWSPGHVWFTVVAFFIGVFITGLGEVVNQELG